MVSLQQRALTHIAEYHKFSNKDALAEGIEDLRAAMHMLDKAHEKAENIGMHEDLPIDFEWLNW